MTTDPTLGTVPHTSAVLEMSDVDKGFLLPRVPLTSSTDQITVPTPISGLLVYNSTTTKFNFWESNQWNRNFELEDALPYIDQTSRFTTNSGTKIVVNGFPTTTTQFTINDGPTGWTDLNVNLIVNPTKTTNAIFLSAEGMAQLNNDNSNNYQFAIGMFVDGQLKVVRKFKYDESGTSCSWKKFDVAGIFFNLTPNTDHQVKLYAKNLTVTNNTGGGYGTGITYGGGAGTCTNLNEDSGRIYLTSQITE